MYNRTVDDIYNYKYLYRICISICTVSVAANDQGCDRTYYFNSSKITRAASSYSLQYSTVVGEWQDSYRDYNCYTYAIGLCDIGRNPGAFSGQSCDSDTMTVFQIAENAAADLVTDSFSYSCVHITDSRPTSLGYGKLVLAVRKGWEKDEHTDYDYHFMRSTNAIDWYHKPGETNPLKYNLLPDEQYDWDSEYSLNNVEKEGFFIYFGDIYYIIASPYHGTTSTELSGNHYHSGKFHHYEYATICTTCRVVLSTEWRSQVCSGPPCMPPGEIMSIEPVTE